MNIADDQTVADLIQLAKREDFGTGDVSTELLPERDQPGALRLLAKDAGVFAGFEIAPAILHAYDRTIEIAWTGHGSDGNRWSQAPVELATIRGPIGPLLSAERVLLNFLQRLCGVATLTRRFVDAVAGTNAVICDTRKTTPGWRTLEKYAVRCGGGTNHRRGLFDAVLIKDNHLTGVSPEHLSARVFEMINTLHDTAARPTFVEVEADDLTQVDALLDVVGVDMILLDNFSLDDLRRAVVLLEQRGLRGKVAMEASGGITLDTVRAVAETGVDRISTGTITHSATALDLSMERV